MRQVRSGIPKPYIRSVVAITMLLTWSLSALTGFLLWVAPNGPRSGRMLLLFGLTKGEWGDFHAWFSAVALILTIVHLIVDWRGFRGCIKYLTNTRREDILLKKLKI